MSTPIFRLPPELLDLILAEFCVHCQNRHEAPQAYLCGDQQQPDQPSWYSLNCHALFQVCLTSRSLLGPAQAVLYHDIMHGYGDSWCTTRFTWDRRLTSFVRTISHRPDLASRVRRGHIDPKLVFFVQPLDCDEALQLAASRLSVGPENIGTTAEIEPECARWNWSTWNQLTFVAPEIFWGLVHVLLLQLSQLQHLSYKSTSRDFLHQRSLVPPTAFRSLSGPSLKTVSAAFEGEYPHWLLEGNVFSNIMGKISLGDLETVNLYMVDIYDGRMEKYPSPSWASVKNLHITKSKYSKAAISALLSSIERLEKFTYEAAPPAREGRNISSNAGSSFLKPHEAIDCLWKFAHSLRNLHLDFEVYKHSRLPSGRIEVGLMSPVTDFGNLEHFLINVGAICSSVDPVDPVFGDRRLLVNLLPRSLQSLEIPGNILSFGSRLVGGLRGLAEAIAGGQFPCLKRITCDDVVPKHEYDALLIPQAFIALRVEFTFSSWPLSKPARNVNGKTFGLVAWVPSVRIGHLMRMEMNYFNTIQKDSRHVVGAVAKVRERNFYPYNIML